MDTSHLKIAKLLEKITKFLTPLLPIANCHMVEFFTDNHWEKHIPEGIRKEVDEVGFANALEKFWTVAHDWKSFDETSQLSAFVTAARSHCLAVDEEICLSTEEFKRRILFWGGQIEPEIRVSEFMSFKKGYEVQTMSRLVSSLSLACGATHCVDVGGGRGQLPTVLARGYGACALTVDCDRIALDSGRKRDRLIEKQWHAIAKKVSERETNNNSEGESNSNRSDLHRYASAYVTKDTDLSGLVRAHFPEHSEGEMKLLLTGLHTCGDLGPSSLRIFAHQPTVVAALNVPCCYHLLTEAADGSLLWNALEKGYGSGEAIEDVGFPLSEFLRGYQLGRNARMLAAQSIDRVVNQRQLPSRSLFYRALLQVIIKTHLKTTIPEGKLKRVSSTCANFTDYLKVASAILDLDLDVLPEDYLVNFSASYEKEWGKLVLFYILRLCIAQVVESVILLDRLLYLREAGCSEAFLVKLFDPVMSPRCHGIVVKR